MSPSPRIAALVPTWRDGQQLAAAVRSIRTAADVVIVLDGGYSGFVPDEHRWSATDELLDAREAGAVLYPVRWPHLGSGANGDAAGQLDPPLAALASESAKRNALLELARRHIGAGWAVFLDADELLANGPLLRDELAGLPDAALAYPLPRIEPDSRVYSVPSHCLRLLADTTFPGCSWLVHSRGRTWNAESRPAFSASSTVEPMLALLTSPYVVHRPHLRADWRADWRKAWYAHLTHDDLAGAAAALGDEHPAIESAAHALR